MNRRSFVSLTALGSATLLLPSALVGCGSAGDASTLVPQGATPVGGGAPPSPAVARGGTVVAAKQGTRRFSDAEGNLFDVSGVANRVDFLSPTGSLRGSVSSGLNFPVSLAVDPTGRVLVLELGGECVRMFDWTGRSLGSFGSSLPLAYPRDIAITTNSRGAASISIADTLSHRVLVCDATGTVETAFGSLGSGSSGLDGPSSVAFAADGSLYVADSGNARVQVLGPNGNVVASLGRRGTGPGQFLVPCCVRLDGSGFVYVADVVGGYVTIFDPSNAYVGRMRPTLPNGATGAPLWISTLADGTLLFGAIPTAAA